MKSKSTNHQNSTENVTKLATWQWTLAAPVIMSVKLVAKSAILLFVVGISKTNPSPRAAHFKYNIPKWGSGKKSKLLPSNALLMNDRMIPSMFFETSVGEGLETIELYIYDKSTDVIIDSGASGNLMSELVFQSLTGGAVALSKCDRNVYVYAHSQPLQLQGGSELTVTVPRSNLSTIAAFYIVPGNVATLLGRKTSEMLQVLEVGVSVNSCDVIHE